MAGDDDLLDRAERLARQQHARAKAHAAGSPSIFSKLWQGLLERSVIIRRTVETLEVIWNYWLKPIAFIVNPLVRGYIRACKWVFTKLSFEGENYNKFKGALAVLGIAFFTVFAGYQTVTRIVPLAFNFTYDALAINLFSYEDTLIFSQPQNVEGDPDTLKVYACRRYPCEGQTDSVEFHIRDSAYLDVVRLITRFEPHDPGELAGAFVSEENGCKISVYGVRNKWLGWYPNITGAICRSINGANFNQVLEEMRGLNAR